MTARRPHLLATALLLGAGAAVSAVELDGLVKNSPFGQAAERTVIGEAKPGTLEFRGLYVDKGVTYFSVYNSITKQSAWIAEGEVPTNLPVTIVGFDQAAETLIVENAGQPVKLPLRTPVISATPSSPVAAPAPVAAAPIAGAVAPQFGGGGFSNGQPPSPEQIQAFRDEMRKRWGERGQGGPGGGSGGGEVAQPTDRSSRSKGEAGATNGAPTKEFKELRPSKGSR
jgi:hypothetical protein